MYSVELCMRVRRACIADGMSIRRASRVFGLHRDTVRKMLKYAAPPGYQRRKPPRRPKIGPYTGVIDQILKDDLDVPRKQRHTAKRIYERLRDEHGFEGEYTIVNDYVRERRRTTREMFVPLHHPPGHAQCDFGEAWAVIAGVKRKVHLFVMDLPHSDGIFVKAYPAETTESFCDGHISAFAFLGGVPQSIPCLRRGRLCTTTPGWQLRGYWEVASASGPRYSLSFSPTTCSPTGSAGRAGATTRATLRAWWDTPGGTSSYPYHRSKASSPSTSISKVAALRDWRRG